MAFKNTKGRSSRGFDSNRGSDRNSDSYSKPFDSRSGGGRFSSGPRFGGRNDSKPFGGRGQKPEARMLMHAAVCAQCSDACEVPFRPFPGQSVLCNNCFSKDGVNSNSKSFSKNNAPRSNQSSAPAEVPQVLRLELNQIHSKIDKILSIVQRMSGEEVVKIKDVEEVQEATEDVVKETESLKKKFTPNIFKKK